MTAKRRAERKQFKLDRAKAIAAASAQAEAAFAEGREVHVALSGPTIPSAATWKPSEEIAEPFSAGNDVAEDEEPMEDVEHLQLTLPEAFFLLWSLDCLTVVDPHTVAILWMRKRRQLILYHIERDYEFIRNMACLSTGSPSTSAHTTKGSYAAPPT